LRTRGNKTLAAELLSLNRTTFIERLRKKGMLQPTRRPPISSSVKKVTQNNFALTPHSADSFDFDALCEAETADAGAVAL
jgi:hypothetical protein